jgi:multidrug resistance efflux pump
MERGERGLNPGVVLLARLGGYEVSKCPVTIGHAPRLVELSLRPGDYLGAGVQALAMIDSDSLRIEAYLEETKLRHVEVGDEARIRMMGEEQDLIGHVEGIAGGIADDQRSNSPNLLPTVNATFTWVRLAQRIPVRVHVDEMPPGTRLILGRTATVTIIPSAGTKGFSSQAERSP